MKWNAGLRYGIRSLYNENVLNENSLNTREV